MNTSLATPMTVARYDVGEGVVRADRCVPYERSGADPVYRPLKIYTIDPGGSRFEGATATVQVPYEPLRPGPRGAVLEVDTYDYAARRHYRRVDLESSDVLIRGGLDPSPSDPLFHQQMTYGVCSLVYASFRAALGRHVAWGFDNAGGPLRLRIQPHAELMQNAYYDKARGALCFGYYRAEDKSAPSELPHGWVFTCLSHDIVVHEMTHALLDGLRTRLALPTNPDVLAFHEGFADLMAVFHHFSYPGVLDASLQKTGGDLGAASLLTDVARQFGQTTGARGPLRSAIDAQGLRRYDAAAEPHVLGSVLVSSIFDAFREVFRRRTERLVRLFARAPGDPLSHDQRAVLAETAGKIAGQFLYICIRAIDYCPPVDIQLGEYLRAVITADSDLVPHDPWGYREAWITAFGRRGIYPPDVPFGVQLAAAAGTGLLGNLLAHARDFSQEVSFASATGRQQFPWARREAQIHDMRGGRTSMVRTLLALLVVLLLASQVVRADERGTLMDALRILQAHTYVDLTHAFGPGIPHWKGFPDEHRETLFWYDRGVGSMGEGFWAQRYSIVGQWGTHVDPPAHFVKGLRTVDEIDLKEMILPLVVIDVHEKAAANPDYVVSMDDIRAWEARHGAVPERSFVALRTDWSRRWPDMARMQNRDAAGVAHYPGWSRPVLAYLYEQRQVTATGHETTDTDPGVATSRNDYSLEAYILSTNHYQIELLANLDRVPESGALVVVTFPKPEKGSGFPARVFAIRPGSR